MADYIPASRPIQQNIPTPLTLTSLQTFVGGFIRFVEIPSGDILVVNEASFDQLSPLNKTASSMANRPIHGDVVLCTSGEIA